MTRLWRALNAARHLAVTAAVLAAGVFLGAAAAFLIRLTLHFNG